MKRLTGLVRGAFLVILTIGLSYQISRIGQGIDSSLSALLPVAHPDSIRTAAEEISLTGSLVSALVLLICLGLGLFSELNKAQ